MVYIYIYIISYYETPRFDIPHLSEPFPSPTQPLSQAVESVDTARPTSSTSSSCPQGNIQILSQGVDGSVVEASLFSGGSVVADVVYRSGSSVKQLGQLKNMVDNKSGFETLQARCKVHSRCICWISSTRHSDLMLQWLAKGGQESFEQHQASAKELKRSIGMKIRG